ncbi:hypothetical protein GOBAR_AA05457 [Gossypium barbadense]|uniref:Formin-like protein n=1 Tax=Gossypium barbadense TaxID=3634 RepID=A0A2P5YHV3_GOSBA|nr:hypothetical protein GOBAR_AA05457 [Gossypium barbadense]
MGLIRTNSLWFLVVLLFASFAVSLDYTKEEEEEAFLNQLVDPSTGEIYDDLAELLWISCRQDLNNLKEAFEDPKLRLSEETRSTINDIGAKSHLLAKEKFQKFIKVIRPELKQVLSDCVRKNKLLFQESGEDSCFKTCYPQYSGSLFRWCEVSRKSLAAQSIAVGSALNLRPTTPRSSAPAPSLANESPDSSTDQSRFWIYGSTHAPGSSKESSQHQKASTNGSDYIESDALQISLDGNSSDGAAADASKASSESSETPGNASSLLPLPPGRAGPGGLPPLKPPPGKEDLTPEAPVPAKSAPPPPPPPSLKSASTNVGPPPPGAPPPPPPKAGAAPPPPSKAGAPPPPPPKAGGGPRPPPPLGSKGPRPPNAPGRGGPGSGSASKAKLKPFFWDKVANTPEQGQVWNQIKGGSFQLNDAKIETLFGYSPVEKSKSDKKDSTAQEPQFIQLLDGKKAQNLAIMLRALNVTSEEVSDALVEGNELPVELLQTLLKMAPTSDEELKLRLFTGEVTQLGPAERFLKVVVDIPFAYQKMETLLFMCSLHDELTATRESFQILEMSCIGNIFWMANQRLFPIFQAACKELKSSRLFLKLLEAVLKTGNRMNDGTFRGGAQAFKLDTLLKLSDVKGVDGKTTLLHFVVLEIIRTEGLRAARIARESRSFSSIKSEDLLEDVSPDDEEYYRNLGLQAVSNLSSELEYVKKAAALDAENLSSNVAKVGHAMVKTRNFLNTEMKDSGEKSGFHETLESFVKNAESSVMSLLEEEKKVMDLVKSTGDYFHGNVKKDEGLRIFSVVRDFLVILDKVCREVKNAPKKPTQAPKKQTSNASTSSESRVAPPSPDPRQKLFPTIAQQRKDDSSSTSSSDEKS